MFLLDFLALQLLGLPICRDIVHSAVPSARKTYNFLEEGLALFRMAASLL